MGRLLARQLNRLLGTSLPCPEIRWDDVVCVEAMGFDAIGPFEVAVSFIHSDGTEATLCVHHDGYDDIVRTLHQRFPTISATWYQDMIARPDWHVERVLYSRDDL